MTGISGIGVLAVPGVYARAGGRGSGGLSAIEAVDDFLDLSSGARDIGALRRMAPEDLQRFVAMLSTLLKQGVVGSEDLETRGEVRRSYVLVRPADPETRVARRGRRLRLRA